MWKIWSQKLLVTSLWRGWNVCPWEIAMYIFHFPSNNVNSGLLPPPPVCRICALCFLRCGALHELSVKVFVTPRRVCFGFFCNWQVLSWPEHLWSIIQNFALIWSLIFERQWTPSFTRAPGRQSSGATSPLAWRLGEVGEVSILANSASRCAQMEHTASGLFLGSSMSFADFSSKLPPFGDDEISVKTEKNHYDATKFTPVLYGTMHAKVCSSYTQSQVHESSCESEV